MKKNIAAVCAELGIAQNLENVTFLKQVMNDNGIPFTQSGWSGLQVEESDIYKIVQVYKVERQKQEKMQAVMNEATSKILVSSGFNFDGYKIVKYSGYISGDDSVQINRKDICDYKPQTICDSLVKIRAQALKELKEAAYALGCNAVIGVDFDYMTFEPETANINGGTTYYPYVIICTANGNAVIIEKE